MPSRRKLCSPATRYPVPSQSSSSIIRQIWGCEAACVQAIGKPSGQSPAETCGHTLASLQPRRPVRQAQKCVQTGGRQPPEATRAGFVRTSGPRSCFGMSPCALGRLGGTRIGCPDVSSRRLARGRCHIVHHVRARERTSRRTLQKAGILQPSLDRSLFPAETTNEQVLARARGMIMVSADIIGVASARIEADWLTDVQIVQTMDRIPIQRIPQ